MRDIKIFEIAELIVTIARDFYPEKGKGKCIK